MKKRFIQVIMILACATASAQEPAPSPSPEGTTLFEYLKDHVSAVSGFASANGVSQEYVSLSLDDDFSIAPKLRGFGNLSLFGRQRVSGESVPSLEIPLSPEDLALYTAGEISGGLYYEFTEKVALECRGGATFAMVGLTGKQGEPVDSTKFLLGCGPRLTGGPGRLSVLFSHYGPVDSGAKWFGFVPNTVFDGEFRLPKSTAFLVRVAAGRDLVTQKAVTSRWFAVRAGF